MGAGDLRGHEKCAAPLKITFLVTHGEGERSASGAAAWFRFFGPGETSWAGSFQSAA